MPEPEQKFPKLIVVVAFDGNEAADLQPVYGPEEQQSEERAIRTAKKLLAGKHAGVIAWSRGVRRAQDAVRQRRGPRYEVIVGPFQRRRLVLTPRGG